VHASAPLHGGTLAGLDDDAELADLFRPGTTTPAACLTAAASCPGVTKILLSTADAGHWQTALAALDQPPIPTDILRKVLDVLAAA
jgi:hypothetical protein